MSGRLGLIALSVALAFSSGYAYADKADHNVLKAPTSHTISAFNSWVEISQSAFENNIQVMQKQLNSKSKLCAVMKADAYGHGISLLMPTVIKTGVDCVAVANNKEIKAVRDSGYTGQLMRVRTATLEEVEEALIYDVEELIGNLEFAQQVAAIAAKNGKEIRYHLGLNSAGMSRNGLEVGIDEGKKQVLELVKLKGLKLVGIMTHYPEEDKADVIKMLDVFNQQTDWLIKAAGLERNQILLHAANSFAAVEVPESHLDMVRVGGALYGDTVPSHTKYQRVMQYKSKVASVNNYPAGNQVGYDRTYTLTRDSKLANIPVGYSDSYRRVFTNKSHVLINGKRAPVVGKVSMNTIMVDVTDIPNVSFNDEVVLFGRQGDGEITQVELEDINDALLADLYTVWGNSNEKVLVK